MLRSVQEARGGHQASLTTGLRSPGTAVILRGRGAAVLP